jgi:hypothetical protein
MLLEILKNNLLNVAQAMLIFLCAYLANMCFSLYLNIGLCKQSFDKDKLISSLIKAVVFLIGLTLLTSVITVLPIFAEMMGWTVPDDFTDILSAMAIIGTVLYTVCKYALEAFQKFSAILNFDKEPKEAQTSEEEQW